MAASSSSACITTNRFPPSGSASRQSPMCFSSASASEDAGVMGYQATTETPPQMAPSAVASFPSIRIRCLIWSAGSNFHLSCFFRFSEAKSKPI